MTPKQKARQLAVEFSRKTDVVKPNLGSIEMALKCTKEVIDQWEYIDVYLSDMGGRLNPNLKYWYDVKQELLKL